MVICFHRFAEKKIDLEIIFRNENMRNIKKVFEQNFFITYNTYI